MLTEFGMKKRHILIGLAALTLLIGGCGTPSGAVSDGAEAPVQAVQTVVEAQAAPPPNPYYTGEGGKSLSIAILAPQGKGLAANQDYLPALVQGEFVSNFSGYSAISVLDRVQLENQYDELFSGYYDDNAEKGMDLGHLTPTDYIMGGNITKTATGYALQIQITKTADKMTTASYSGTCTFAELDNLSGVRRATLDLLQKMGVEPTERTKTELAGAAAANHVNAQTALAQGITAQQGGTVVEALSCYYQAASFDSSLLEAANRASVTSAAISSGNIGADVRNDIQRRREWQKLLTEAEDYFSKHIPWEIVYYPTLTQGRVDYSRETVDMSFIIEVRPTDGWKIVQNLIDGLDATGKRDEWGLTGWPLTSRVFADYPSASSQLYRSDRSAKQTSITCDLLNEKGKLLASETIICISKARFDNSSFFNTAWKDLPQKGYREYSSSDVFRLIRNDHILTDIERVKVTFKNVNANDITDNMTVKIVSVNDIDAETIGKTGYIRISAGGMR
ncbi:MAG: hypothetical protein LBK08_00830 [Treponema sp.]|jgi:hypothetical protein|nr:hypothetical protein [Treponema sp.]